MEIPTVETEERILVYENLKEIERITGELKNRLLILNKLNAGGLSPNEIKTFTASQAAIDRYIFDLQLKNNKELSKLHKAGIRVPADLPDGLQQLKYSLSAWLNHRMDFSGSNKFSGLLHDGTHWQIDNEQLERHFQARGIKVWIEGDQLAEYHDYQALCDILTRRGMYHGQVFQSQWLKERIENTADGLKVRGAYFRKEVSG